MNTVSSHIPRRYIDLGLSESFLAALSSLLGAMDVTVVGQIQEIGGKSKNHDSIQREPLYKLHIHLNQLNQP